MASPVEICNLALSFLGDSGSIATINTSDGTAQSSMCATYYPIAKAAMLEMHEWSFATRRKVLAQVDGEDTLGWAGVYALPSDCLRTIRVQAYKDQQANKNIYGQVWGFETTIDANFERVGERIFTNAPDPVLTYLTSEVTEGHFSPTFVTAFAYYLAMEIAGSRIKGEEGQKLAANLNRSFQQALSIAKTRDANQQRKQVVFTPTWILRR